MTVYFNGEKYQQLGFMHLKVDVIIFSTNETIFDFSGLRTTIYNSKNKRSLSSHRRYLSFKIDLFFPSTLLEVPTIPLRKRHKPARLLHFLTIKKMPSITPAILLAFYCKNQICKSCVPNGTYRLYKQVL
jgi:hypothetical protein